MSKINIFFLYFQGSKWHQRRKILTPTFHFNILKQFCQVFVEKSESMIKKLHDTNGKAVNVFPYITDFALNSICGIFYHSI